MEHSSGATWTGFNLFILFFNPGPVLLNRRIRTYMWTQLSSLVGWHRRHTHVLMLQYLGCALSVTSKGGKTSLCGPHNKATWGNCSCELALNTYTYNTVYPESLHADGFGCPRDSYANHWKHRGQHCHLVDIKEYLFTQWTSPFIFLGWLDVLLINS